MEGDTIHVPSWRSDVEHYSDIAEEVARFYGYNNIPDTLSNGLTARRGSHRISSRRKTCWAACAAPPGTTRSSPTPSSAPPIMIRSTCPRIPPCAILMKILNPLGEDTSIMRTTTLPSMLEILTRNYNFRNKSAKLYELGRVYLPSGPTAWPTSPRCCPWAPTAAAWTSSPSRALWKPF